MMRLLLLLDRPMAINATVPPVNLTKDVNNAIINLSIY